MDVTTYQLAQDFAGPSTVKPGVYTVRKAPHEWPDAETLVDNNFRNMFARDAENDGIEAAKKETRE